MAKWISFIEQKLPVKKTKTYFVMNTQNGVNLGTVKWFGAFRQYSFFPSSDMVFEKTCMRDIADFMQNLMDERKLNK